MGDGISRLVQEAERQDFLARPVAAGGAWLFKRGGTMVLVSTPKDADGVLDMLHLLILAGLVWPPPD